MYQQWLDDHGVHATVNSGNTGENRTVNELKRDTLEQEIERLNELTETLQRDNQALREQVAELTQQKNIQHNWGQPRSWGKELSW